MITKKLRKGDLILVRPKVLYKKIENIPSKIIAKVNMGITHVALYIGHGKVIHCDYKVGVNKVRLKDFMKHRAKFYKSFDYLIVRPKYYGENLIHVFEKANNYLFRQIGYSVKHLIRMIGFIIKGFEKVTEPIVFDSFAVCSTFVARILKEANVDIGKKASVAFMPIDFTDKRYFEVKN